MRAAIMAVMAFALIGLAAPVQAAPLAPHDMGVAGSGVLLVRNGCGPGWHRVWWRGPYGHPHSRCVPNRRWY